MRCSPFEASPMRLGIKNGTFEMRCSPQSLKSACSTIIMRLLQATLSTIINFRIMTTRQIIYASTIIVLGNILLFPCVLLFSSTIIGCALGFLYILFLFFILGCTRNGRWFFVEWYRSVLRIEKLILGTNVDAR